MLRSLEIGLLVFFGLSIFSVSSSGSSSSFSSLAFAGSCFASEGIYFGGDTGESSSSPSSTLLRPFTPDGCLGGGGLLADGLRPGEDKSSGRIGLSIGNEGLRRPKCLSDKKDNDSEVRTKCSKEEREVGLVPVCGAPGKPVFIELVVEDTEEGLDGSSSLSSSS